MLRLRCTMFAALACGCIVASAHADTFSTFYLTSTLDPTGGVTGGVTGTVTFDQTTGMFTNSNLVGVYTTTYAGSGTYNVPAGPPTGQGISGSNAAYYTTLEHSARTTLV